MFLNPNLTQGKWSKNGFKKHDFCRFLPPVSRFLHPLQLLITQSFQKVESFYRPFSNSPGKDESEYVFESKFGPWELVKKSIKKTFFANF